jgi:hypothetical protein
MPPKTGRIIFISDKVGFKPKLIGREKDHFILIKGAIYQEEITSVNLYAPNVGAPNFIKHILLDLKTHRPKHSCDGRLYYSSITNR